MIVGTDPEWKMVSSVLGADYRTYIYPVTIGSKIWFAQNGLLGIVGYHVYNPSIDLIETPLLPITSSHFRPSSISSATSVVIGNTALFYRNLNVFVLLNTSVQPNGKWENIAGSKVPSNLGTEVCLVLSENSQNIETYHFSFLF